MSKVDLKKALIVAGDAGQEAHYSAMMIQGWKMCNGQWVPAQGPDPVIPPETDSSLTCAPEPLLHQAQALIHGQRQQDYGDKLTNFSQVSMMWQGYLAPKLLPESRITPEDVTFLMIQLKLARLSKSPDHRDSILDVAGYAGCADYLQQERAAGAALPGAVRDARS